MTTKVFSLAEDPCFSSSEIIDFVAKIFTPNYFESLKVQKISIGSEPSLKPENFIIAKSASQLIGLVRIVEREILIANQSFRAAGISSVSVHPEFRGKGLSIKLMEKALAEIGLRQFDFSYLHGRKAVDGFYTQFGFTGVGRYNVFNLLTTKASATKYKFHVEEMTSSNLPLCAMLYESIYSKLDGSIARNLATWEFLLARNSTTKEFKLLTIAQDSEILGYVVVANGRIFELALNQKSFDLLSSILDHLDVKTLELHPRHPALSVLRRFNHSYEERLPHDGGYMLKVSNLKSCLDKFEAIARQRINVTSPLQLDDAADPNLSQMFGDDKNHALEFYDQNLLPLLLIGRLRPENLVRNLDSYSTLLQLIFPETGFHTCKIDEI